MTLFKKEVFISHAGLKLPWKVECDALGEHDWICLASIAYELLPKDPYIIDYIPTGGKRFAEAFRLQYQPYEAHTCKCVLIFDDVYTTGQSMEERKELWLKLGRDYVIRGCVAFARTAPPAWIKPIWLYGVHLND
jgi:hypoxanthine phosphoribosyltransferase